MDDDTNEYLEFREAVDYLTELARKRNFSVDTIVEALCDSAHDFENSLASPD